MSIIDNAMEKPLYAWLVSCKLLSSVTVIM